MRAFGRLLDVMIDLCRRGQGNQIVLKASATEQNVCLVFQMDGGSLPRADAERITRFFAADGEAAVLEASRYSPSLTVVKQIIALHDGTIALEEAEWHRLTCRITLPTVAVSAAAEG